MVLVVVGLDDHDRDGRNCDGNGGDGYDDSCFNFYGFSLSSFSVAECERLVAGLLDFPLKAPGESRQLHWGSVRGLVGRPHQDRPRQRHLLPPGVRSPRRV